jgi:ribonuclease T2
VVLAWPTRARTTCAPCEFVDLVLVEHTLYMTSSFARALANISLLLLLATVGCQSPTPIPDAPRSHTETRPSSPAYQPQQSSSYPRNDEQRGRGRRRSRRGRPNEAAAPGQFDFYLLNLSWSPEFCATHANSPECGRRLGFVVHGLWPQDANGDYPQHCSDAPGPANPRAYTNIIPTESLVMHEWQTHGTCSGLAADDYFAEIHKAYATVKMPANIGRGNDADGVTPADLLARFAAANPAFPAESFALSCGNNRLTAVEICLSKDLRPEACQGVRSCRANVVKVTPQ